MRKTWEAFIIPRDRIVLRDHHKVLSNQKKFDAQLKAAQQTAGQQIDNTVHQSLAHLDAKVKSIIKDTVKSTSIKKETMSFDQSLLECELTSTEANTRQHSRHTTSSSSSKRYRQPELIDLRSPVTSHSGKKHDARKDAMEDSTQSKGSLNTKIDAFPKKDFINPLFCFAAHNRIWKKLWHSQGG